LGREVVLVHRLLVQGLGLFLHVRLRESREAREGEQREGDECSSDSEVSAFHLFSVRMNCTRRLSARFASLVLGTMGCVMPYPLETRREASIPCDTRYWRTLSARDCDSLRLYAAPPTLSVWPWISSVILGFTWRTSRTASRIG